MRTLSIETTIHGRVVVREPAGSSPAGLLVAFHGYGQSADEMLEDVAGTPGLEDWRIASVQGLHRFYTRRDQRVVASWMTREDRDDAIVDNVAYVQRVIDTVREADEPVVFVGFSQGASMAYRAAVLGRYKAAGVVAVGGDVPPELKDDSVDLEWPPVLVAAGVRDPWFTGAKLQEDVSFLDARGIEHELLRYDGAHEWTDELRAHLGDWVQASSSRPPRT